MELNEQKNKWTSLKAMFKSVDPTKHFHGNDSAKYKPTVDQPDPSTPQLVSKQAEKNRPTLPPKSLKNKLLSVYKKD